MRITTVTTKTGDFGTTQLVGGQEVSKDDPRVQAYGTVDELNSVVGLVRSSLSHSNLPVPDAERLDTVLAALQDDLFNLGGTLATLPVDRTRTLLDARDVQRLEVLVEEFNAVLPPLEEFVRPGGELPTAFLHQGRTVCRRAERCVVTLVRSGVETDMSLVRYLNRLSDLLFVLSRWTGARCGAAETMWARRK